MRLVDVYMYNGDPIAKVRSQVLAGVVDHTVVVQALESHNPEGPRRDEPWPWPLPGCQRLVVEAFPAPPASWTAAPWMTPGSETAWWRERYQRDAAGVALRPGDVVFCSDADELPDPRVLLELKALARDGLLPAPVVHFDMTFFQGSFDFVKQERWARAFLAVWTPGMSLTDLRVARPLFTVPCAGWHCTNFDLDATAVRRKLASFAHAEFRHVEPVVGRGVDPLGRPGHDAVPTPPELAPPAWVLEHARAATRASAVTKSS